MNPVLRKKQILDESIRWIRGNPFASNHDVPTHLREHWVYVNPEDQPPADIPLSVFVFGYCHARVKGANQAEVVVTATEISEKFQLWQMKLVLAEINQKAGIQSSPMPLFSFLPAEEVHVWEERSPTDGD